MAKTKIGGCKKRLRKHKVSKGIHSSIAKPFGNGLSAINAHRFQ